MAEREPSRRKQDAGLFDIRNIIGALLFLYGVVLTLLGIFGHTAADEAKAAGINANLWTGVPLILVGVAFATWARLRPIVVDERDIDDSEEMRRRALGDPDQPR